MCAAHGTPTIVIWHGNATDSTAPSFISDAELPLYDTWMTCEAKQYLAETLVRRVVGTVATLT